MNDETLKIKIKETFDTVAEGYDCDALRFFPASARRLTDMLAPQPGEHILDVATGTGAVALTIAQRQPDATVTGIDISEGMLNRARRKASTAGIENVTFLTASLPQLELPTKHYDAATCGFGIFFLEDMVEGMRQIVDKLKPGGRLIISSFFEPSFSPLADVFAQRIEAFGLEPPSQMWKRIADKPAMSALFHQAGINTIQTETTDLSYYLKDTDAYWNFLWNAGFRGLLNQLSDSDLVRFKSEHLAEIAHHATEQGLLLRVETLYGAGTKVG